MLIDRRHFLKTSGLAIAATLFPSSSRAFFRAGTFTPVRGGVGTFESRGGTIGWYISDGAVVVVDSQFPESAEECRDGIAERADRTIDLLINSHHHGDHTAGNSVLGADADHILAHRNVPKLQRAQAEGRGNLDDQVFADLLYDETWKQDAGDETISLKYYGAAHTAGDSVIHFQNANVAHVGDLVFNRMPCFIDLKGGASTAHWIEVLEGIHEDYSDETIFIFGHGNPANGITGTRSDLLHMRDFLTGLWEYVDEGIKAGKSEDALLVDRLPGFEEHYVESWADGIRMDIKTVFQEISGSAN
jgi:cyclase